MSSKDAKIVLKVAKVDRPEGGLRMVEGVT